MASYWIDTKNGDNANAGGTGDPWQTWSYAIAHMSNGDTLNMRGSDASDEIYYERGLSTAGKTNLTFQADTGHSPVVCPFLLVPSGSWTKTPGQTNAYEATYTPGACWVVWHGSTVLTPVASIAACDALANSFFFDDPGNKLYTNVGGGAPGDIHTQDTTNRVLTIPSASTGCVLDGLRLKWFGLGVDAQGGGTFKNMSIENFYPYSLGWNVFLCDKDVSLEDCTFVGYGSSRGYLCNLDATATSLTISGCTITDFYYPIYQAAGSTTAISVTTSNFARALDFLTNASGAIGNTLSISYSTFTDHEHGIFTLNGVWDATLHHNIIYLTADNVKIAHGFIFHNSGTANLYHNTVAWLNRSSFPGGNGREACYFAPVTGSLLVTARNNLIYQCRSGFHEVSGTITYDLDYSGFYGNTNDYEDIAAEDQGMNDVTADPLFTDAPNNDFTLQTGSPEIGAGEFVADVSEQTPPSIGKWEYATGCIPQMIHLLKMAGG